MQYEELPNNILPFIESLTDETGRYEPTDDKGEEENEEYENVGEESVWKCMDELLPEVKEEMVEVRDEVILDKAGKTP